MNGSPRSATEPSDRTDAVTLEDFLRLVDLDPLDGTAADVTRWVGAVQQQPAGRVYGGLLLAQAVVAGGRTVAEGQELLGLQAEFVQGVPTDRPILWEVERVSGSASMSLRRATARDEEGRELFTATTRWGQVRSDLPSFDRSAARSVPGPDGLAGIDQRFGDDDRVPSWWRRPRPVDFRPTVEPPYVRSGERPEGPGRQSVWVRAAGTLPDDPVVEAALLAYLTDMSLLEGAFLVLGAPRHAPGSKILSLSHSLVLHGRPGLGDWHQFDATVATMAHGRVLGSGEIFDVEGRLVASAAQLGLVGAAR